MMSAVGGGAVLTLLDNDRELPSGLKIPHPESDPVEKQKQIQKQKLLNDDDFMLDDYDDIMDDSDDMDYGSDFGSDDVRQPFIKPLMVHLA
jgi:hypothetical protein